MSLSINELNNILKDYQELKKKERELYEFQRDKFKYTHYLKKDHPEYIEMKKWEEKYYKPIQNKLFKVKNKIEGFKRERLQSLKSYIKLGKSQIKILEFIKNKRKGYSIKEISNKLNINESTIRNAMKTLMERKFIEKEREGRSFIYFTTELGKSFNKFNKPLKVKDVMLLDHIVEDKSKTLNEIKNKEPTKYFYNKDSLELLINKGFLKIINGNVRITKKGKIEYKLRNLNKL